MSREYKGVVVFKISRNFKLKKMPLSKEQQRAAMSIMTSKMLEGWTLLSSHCPICTTTLIKSKTNETFCSACNAPVVTSLPSSSTSSLPVTTKPVSSLSSSPTSSSPISSTSLSVTTETLLQPTRQTSRARDDEASSRLGQRLLNGWKMLAEGCNKCGTPLMQPLKSMGGGEPECVMCVEVGPPPEKTSSSSPISGTLSQGVASQKAILQSPSFPPPSRAYVPSPLNPLQKQKSPNIQHQENIISDLSQTPISSSTSSSSPWLAALDEVKRGILIDEESGPRARTTSSSLLSRLPANTTAAEAATTTTTTASGSNSNSNSNSEDIGALSVSDEQLVQQWESMMRLQKQQFDQQHEDLMSRMRVSNPQLASLLSYRHKEKNAQLQLQVVQLQNKVQAQSPPKTTISPRLVESSIRSDGASGGTSTTTAPGGYSTAPGQTAGMPVFGSTVLSAPIGWESMTRDDINDYISKKIKAADTQIGHSGIISHEAPNFPVPLEPVLTPPPILSSSSSSSSLLINSSSIRPNQVQPTTTRNMHTTLTAELLEEARRNGAATAAAAIAAASSSSSASLSTRIGSLNGLNRFTTTPLSPPLVSLTPPPLTAIVPGQLLRFSDVTPEDGNIGPSGIVKFIGSRILTLPEPSEEMIQRIEKGLEKAAQDEKDEKENRIEKEKEVQQQQQKQPSQPILNPSIQDWAKQMEVLQNQTHQNDQMNVSIVRKRVLNVLERALDERCEELLASGGEEHKLIERRWIFEGIKSLAETVAALRIVS
jgi:uncharacterized Zn finger protein (UPF0148 family)